MADLITAANYRDFYQGLTGTSEDAKILRLVAFADAALAIWCGNPATTTGVYTWTSASYEIRSDGPLESQPLAIDLESRVFSTPSATLDTVYVDPTWTFTTAANASGFYLDKTRGWVWLTPSATDTWSTSPLANRLLLTGGFSTTPPEVIEACAVAVKALMEGGSKPEGYTTLNRGDRLVTRAEATRLLPRQSMELMAPWRGIWGG